MDLTVIDGGTEVSHVKLSGRMDPHGTTQIRDRLRAETVERGRPAVVDLREVTFITSVGIGLLVDCSEGTRRVGCKFVLVPPAGHADEVLRKTGVYEIIPSASDVDAAIALTKEPPS
jgi:anti-anti-sigma factor